MRRKSVVAGVVAATVSFSASAETVVTISKSQQRLAVTVDGTELYRWPVSTGRRGLDTPSGTFRPIRFERKWYSRKYDWSPMPYSIFFHRGYAVHGSYETRRLGHPASHGCVRLLPVNAATLFNLVRKEGKGDTRIVVTDRPLPPLAAQPMVENTTRPSPENAVKTARVEKPAPKIEIAVPLPAPVKPQFDPPKVAALPIALPVRDVPLPQKRFAPATEAEINVPLPSKLEPQFAVLAAPPKAVLEPPKTAAKEPSHAALANVPVPRRREAMARPVDRQIREARAATSMTGHGSYTSVGSEAEVMRGREAWLRSLDRRYGIVR